MKKTNYRYRVDVVSAKGSKRIDTRAILDLKRNVDLLGEKPGLKYFGDLADLKESLCWCLNCDHQKMKIKWMNTKSMSYGTVLLAE